MLLSRLKSAATVESYWRFLCALQPVIFRSTCWSGSYKQWRDLVLKKDEESDRKYAWGFNEKLVSLFNRLMKTDQYNLYA